MNYSVMFSVGTSSGSATAMQDKLEAYLSGRIDLSALEEWLVEHLQGILDSGDTHAIETANRLDALLVERSESLVPDDQIKAFIYGSLCPAGGVLTLAGTLTSNPTHEARPEVVSIPTTLKADVQLAGVHR